MDNPNSIINIGELAKPANTLIEKISDAIGGIFKPYQIRRVAQAQADADKIQAAAQIEITDLERRAMARFFVEEAKKQNNIEDITRQALPQVTETAKPQEVEDDWITHFFDRARLISDNDMQKLWATLLAGQANAPGSYTKRTIDVLANLEKADAIVFTKLCGFAFMIGRLTPLIYDLEAKIYTDQGINFGALSHLESLGLLHFNYVTEYVRRGLGQSGNTFYFGSPVWIGFSNPAPCELHVGQVLLTKPGEELAMICDAQPVDGFVEYVREKWKGLGYKTEPEPEPSAAQPSATVSQTDTDQP